jgi:hypothetical protein
MSVFVLTNVRLFAGGADLTSRNNKCELAQAVEDKITTNYGSGGWQERLGGLGEGALAASGQWEAGDLSKVDDQDWANLGAINAFTVCPSGAALGATAWLVRAMETAYKLGGTVGDVAPWEAAAASSWPVSRGGLIHPADTPRTSSGNGSGVQLVAASAGQYLYSSLNVYSVADPAATLTVTVQSSVDNTFASPTTVFTFTGVSAVGGQMLRLAGPSTNTWYRVTWTIAGGSTPSFMFVAALGVK